MKPNLNDEALAASAGFKIVKTQDGYVYKPIKSGRPEADLKGNIKKNLRILDEQNATQRFKWINLPSGLTGALVERMLYYRGQLCFFYMPDNNTFYMLPYSAVESWDVYGRPGKALPLVFAGPDKGGQGKDKDRPFIAGFTKNIYYDYPTDGQHLKDAFLNGCITLKDYTPQLPDTIIPRAELMDSILDMMSECFPLARTQLISNCGVKGMRVDNQEAKDEVIQAANNLKECALKGLPYIPILGSTEFQDFGSEALKVEDYLLDMQSLDNFRLSLHGLSSGGIFEKSSQVLQSEQDMNARRARSSYQDAFELRAQFCKLVNSVWDLGVAVIPAQMSGEDERDDNPTDKIDGGSNGMHQDDSNEEATDGTEDI